MIFYLSYGAQDKPLSKFPCFLNLPLTNLEWSDSSVPPCSQCMGASFRFHPGKLLRFWTNTGGGSGGSVGTQGLSNCWGSPTQKFLEVLWTLGTESEWRKMPSSFPLLWQRNLRKTSAKGLRERHLGMKVPGLGMKICKGYDWTVGSVSFTVSGGKKFPSALLNSSGWFKS